MIQQPSRRLRIGKPQPIVVTVTLWGRTSREQEQSRRLRGLIRFTADQVRGLPVMRAARPIRWQDSSIGNPSIIIKPAPTRYWGATPVGFYSASGWSGYVIVWGGALMRVPVDRRTR